MAPCESFPTVGGSFSGGFETAVRVVVLEVEGHREVRLLSAAPDGRSCGSSLRFAFDMFARRGALGR